MVIRLIRGLITNMERKTCKSSAAELRLIRHNKHGRLNANQILKVGVTEVRYITLKHARPWLIHTLRNRKGYTVRQRDSDQVDDSFSEQTGKEFTEPSSSQSGLPAGESTSDGSTPVTMNVDDSISTSLKTSSLSTPPRNTGLSTPPKTTGLSTSQKNSGLFEDGSREAVPHSSEGQRGTRKRKVEDTDSAQFVLNSMYEKIRLICRPWKKPEGSLNRPMLKLLLESHLTYIMTNPGVSEADIIRKFSPHLQPIVVKEVIEILDELDCLSKTYLKQTKKSSLFDSSSTHVVHSSYEGDSVVYEANIDCTFKLGQFLAHLCS